MCLYGVNGATTTAVRDDPDSLLTGAGILTRALQTGLLTGTRRGRLAEEVLPSSQGRRRPPVQQPEGAPTRWDGVADGHRCWYVFRRRGARVVVVTPASVNRVAVSEALGRFS